MTALPVYPFDYRRLIGTITEVGPATAKMNLPQAAVPAGQWLHGHRLGTGEVGDLLLVECGDTAIFGRLISVRLPERERLTVEPELGSSKEAHPLGTIQLLATVAIKDGAITGGIPVYPRLGSRVYSAHPLLVKWIAECAQGSEKHPDPINLNIATIPAANDTPVSFTPERLFGRHCAVLGATGGGKSWTLARIIEEASRLQAKVILFDATGEFHTLSGVQHVHIGCEKALPEESTEVVVPYFELTESDLFALFRPSGQTQGPKLRIAMKSLKLAKVVPALAPNGHIPKVLQSKRSHDEHYKANATALDAPTAAFDVKFLARQITEECVWPSGGSREAPDFNKWGNPNDQERAYCVTLLARIEEMLASKDMACIFQPSSGLSVFSLFESFLRDEKHRVLRISLKHVPFGHDTREVIVNAMGRHLLSMARDLRFREHPLLVFLDEAHQFLNKQLGDENSRYPLDSFELIAKEGRKFSLNICIATQRPRDLPEGILSQIGTLVVHRLTNDKDREVVERSSGDIDRSAAAFLPTLAPGQAIVIGVDFPMPLTIQIGVPTEKPDSRGPDYQKFWRKPVAAKPSVSQVK